MFPRGSRRAALQWIHTPTENQAAITPTPGRTRFPVTLSSPERVPVAKTTARLGISGASPWTWMYFQVFWAPERVWRQGKRISVSGAAENLAAECVRSFQWEDGQNHA